LVMGVTLLEPNNMWNTMPVHTHARRMEVYFYFDIAENNVVFHLMGEPEETRHIVIRNEQAVISPSWSIHAGMGTGNYAFIWAMAGADNATTDVPALLMYLRSFRANQFASGAAIAMVLLVMVAAVIVPYLRYSLRKEVKV